MNPGASPHGARPGGHRAVLVLTTTFPRWLDDTQPPFVFELCRRLARHYEVHVLAPHAPGCRRHEILDGVQVHRFRYAPAAWERLAYGGGILPNLRERPLRALLVPAFLASAWLAALQLLRRRRFAAVHAHWLVPTGLVAALAAPLGHGRPPLLVTGHGADVFGLKGTGWSRIKRFVADRSARLTVVSRHMRDALIAAGVTADKIDVLSMGVDLLRRFTPPQAGAPRSGILFVGRLVEKKGVDILLQAMPEILRRHPAAKLTVVGDGPERNALALLRERLGLGDVVSFRGAVPQQALPELYRRAAVTVFPSIVARGGDEEGLGLVPLEAMGCGCPVVASALPAIGEVVRDGETGLLVPPGDAAALATAVAALLHDPQRAAELAAGARQAARDGYDWEQVAAAYLRLIDELRAATGKR